MMPAQGPLSLLCPRSVDLASCRYACPPSGVYGRPTCPIEPRGDAFEFYCKEVIIPVAVQSCLPIPQRRSPGRIAVFSPGGRTPWVVGLIVRHPDGVEGIFPRRAIPGSSSGLAPLLDTRAKHRAPLPGCYQTGTLSCRTSRTPCPNLSAHTARRHPQGCPLHRHRSRHAVPKTDV